jgi:hypothetical protein
MSGSEPWTSKKTELPQARASEMGFLRYVKDCRKIDYLTNEDIRTELGDFL